MSAENFLVVVHPGSCCGSADMNLGRYDARACRDGLVALLDRHTGPILVVDGELSDELEGDFGSYASLGKAIRDAVARCSAAGHVARRVWGPDDEDPHFTEVLPPIFADLSAEHRDRTFVLCGAWHDAELGGCVDAVEKIVVAAGLRARQDEAFDINMGTEPDDDEEMDDAPTP